MKDLQPAMREDTRYLRFKIHSEEKKDISEVVDSFWDVAISYIGMNKLSKAEPWFIANRFDEEKQEGVIQVNKKYLSDLRAALTILDSIGSEEGFLTVEKVSGSISNL